MVRLNKKSEEFKYVTQKFHPNKIDYFNHPTPNGIKECVNFLTNYGLTNNNNIISKEYVKIFNLSSDRVNLYLEWLKKVFKKSFKKDTVDNFHLKITHLGQKSQQFTKDRLEYKIEQGYEQITQENLFEKAKDLIKHLSDLENEAFFELSTFNRKLLNGQRNRFLENDKKLSESIEKQLKSLSFDQPQSIETEIRENQSSPQKETSLIPSSKRKLSETNVKKADHIGLESEAGVLNAPDSPQQRRFSKKDKFMELKKIEAGNCPVIKPIVITRRRSISEKNFWVSQLIKEKKNVPTLCPGVA